MYNCIRPVLNDDRDFYSLSVVENRCVISRFKDNDLSPQLKHMNC